MPTGGLLIPSLDAMLQVRMPDHASSSAINMVLNLQSLKFDRFGEYSRRPAGRRSADGVAAAVCLADARAAAGWNFRGSNGRTGDPARRTCGGHDDVAKR